MNSPSPGSLADILDRQAPLLEQLLEYLQREQDVLLQGVVEGEALKDIATDKKDCLSLLVALEQNRLSVLADFGGGTEPFEQEQLCRQAGCLEGWNRVQRMAQKAQQLNQSNGTLIQKKLQHNRNLLDFLRELTSGTVYDADGQSRRSGSLYASA